MNYKSIWKGTTLVECFKSWTEDKSVSSSLPALICWYIWIERSSTTLENSSPSILSLDRGTLGSLRSLHVTQKLVPVRSCLVTQLAKSNLACFDGATQFDGKICGAEGV